MAITVPALKGQMGTISYYQTKMRAKELIAVARPASERDDWADKGLEERIQRELNKKRVRDEIVPYLANFADRFFGSLLVLVEAPETFEYESAAQFLQKDVPATYRKTLVQVGTLTIDGGEMIVLDGQHRFAALRSVIQKENDKEEEVAGPYVTEVPNDELVIIFIEHESTETTRRIFNKINKTAKPVGRSDNIIINEDDGHAIIARRLIEEGAVLGQQRETREGKYEPIVNWRSTTISERSAHWTTLSAVHDTVMDILKHKGKDFDEKSQRPDDSLLAEALDIASDWWTAMLNGVEAFKTIQADPNNVPQIRADHSEWGLLLKPAMHMVIFKAVIKAAERGTPRDLAISRLNKLPWHIKDGLWENVIVSGGSRITARSENFEVTAELIAYLIGREGNTPEIRERARARVAHYRGMDDYELPDPIA